MKYLLNIIVLFFIDIFFKDKIENTYINSKKKFSRNKLSNYIDIHKVHNFGFAFGSFDKSKRIVKYISIIICSLIIIKLYKLIKYKDKLYKIFSLILIISGGISNIRDRLKYGYVIDYFSFRYGKLKFLIFNLGDIYIIFGIILYIIGGVIFG